MGKGIILLNSCGWEYYKKSYDAEGYAVYFYTKGEHLISIGWIGCKRTICGSIH